MIMCALSDNCQIENAQRLLAKIVLLGMHLGSLQCSQALHRRIWGSRFTYYAPNMPYSNLNHLY
jgi:hypothetical protein